MNKDTINEYYLERYVLGELPEEETEEILHLASEYPEIKDALQKIELSNQNILSLYPASKVKANLLSRHRKKTPQINRQQMVRYVLSFLKENICRFICFCGPSFISYFFCFSLNPTEKPESIPMMPNRTFH